MAGIQDVAAYEDVMVVLATAAVVVPLVQRLRVSPVLGFLIAGAVLGPNGLGQLADRIPGLSWVTVGDQKGLGLFGELGVVFLLFLIGLELSLPRLVTMRRLVFGLGGSQVALSAIAIGLAAAALGAPPAAATLIGFSLALSSTAIVLELLSGQQRMATATGRASFSVLLLQDLAVVPLLLLVGALGTGNEGSVGDSLIKAFGLAAVVIGVIVVAGGTLLRPLFRLVASSDNAELFIAAVLLVAVGSGLITAAAGLSMALGSFVAGLLLAETEYRRAIEETLEPFKGLLLGVFFFTVGMSIDIIALIRNPLPIVAGIIALVALKGAVVAGLIRLFGFRWPVAVESAVLLAPGGEFAFIVIGMSIAVGAVAPDLGAYVLAVTSLTMALIPVFDALGRKVSGRLREDSAPDPALSLLPPEEKHPRAIVVGCGRVGELVSDMLARHRVEHVITERAPNLVTAGRADGKPVYFGDGKNKQFLERCGLRHAKAVIITIHTWSEIDDLVRAVRAEHPRIVIVSRARDAEHARHLYEIGVTDAVPETIEASLQLSEAALIGLGVATGPVIASIHERRDEFRAALQKASITAGQGASHGLRSKVPAKAPKVK